MSKELGKLIDDLTQSRLSRRQFIARAAALGISMSAIGSILAACGGGAATPAPTETSTPTETATATETPAVTETATATATAASGGKTAADTIVIAASGDIAGWDPATSIFWLANEVVINTHDVLIDYNTADDQGLTRADVGSMRPELAESYNFSSDGKTLTLKLRDGIKFSNGDPCDAEAVKESFIRYLNLPGTTQFLVHDMGNVTSPDQIEVVDSKTVKFTVPEANPMLLKIVPEMNMVPLNVKEIKSHATSSDKDSQEWTKTHTTGTGPYLIDKYEPGTQLVLKANPSYWGGEPKVKQIVYRVVPTPENRLQLLKNGDVDIVYEVPLKDVASLKNTPGVVPISVSTPGNTNVIMNNKMAPFDNVKFRQAVAYAVNYDRIINEANYGLAAPLTSSVPKGVQYHIDSLPYKYDPEKAKALLAEAGYPNGQGLQEIHFALKTGVPEEENTAIYLQDDLKQVGINMVIDKMAMAAHEDALHKFELAMTFNYFIPYVPDPVYHLYWNYSPKSDMNYQQYDNPEVAQMIDDATKTVDPAKSQQLVEEIQRKIAPDCPILYLYQPTWNLALSDKIKGYIYYPDHLTRFKYMSKA